MAESRPFSTQYKGQSISPVPSGYIEAYSRIGQGMAEMGKQVGEDVNKIFESYKKNADENEAINSAWDSARETYGGFIKTAYGENSPQMEQYKKDVAAFPSLSLSQRKAKYATYNSMADNAKSQLVAEEIGANRTRVGIQAAGAKQGEAYEKALSNQTITVNNVTMRTSAEVDAMDRKLTEDFQKAKEGGYDLKPHMEARAKFEAAKAKLLAQGYRTNNTLSAAALIADEAEKKAEAERKTTGTTADAVGAYNAPTKYSTPSNVLGLTEQDFKASEVPVPENAKAGAKAVAAQPKTKFVIPKGESARNTYFSKNFKSLRDWAGSLQDALEGNPLQNVFDPPDSLDIVEANAGDKFAKNFETDLQASTKAMQDRAESMRKRLEDGIATLEKAEKDGTTGSLYFVSGDNIPVLANGNINLPIAGQTLTVTSDKGSISGAGQKTGNLNTPEKVASAKEQMKKQLADIDAGIAIIDSKLSEVSFESDGEQPTTVRTTQVARAAKAETATAAQATAKPKILLADAVKKATETLQSGNEFEIPFSTGGEVDPLLRAVIFHNPEVRKPDGTIDMTLAAQVLTQTLAAKVDVLDNKLVVKPVEIEPITYQQIDLNSARNAEDAARIAMRNGVIKELQARGIPATADNIALATTGRLVDQETGTEYTPEYSSGGVLRGKPIKSETGMSPLDAVKLQREQLGLQEDIIKQQGRELGRRVVNPNTGRSELIPVQFSETLPSIAPTDSPSVAGVAPTADMTKYKERLSNNTKLIEIVREKAPASLRRFGQEKFGNPDHFIDRFGNINGEALNASEQAKKEYISVLFEAVRPLGQGLGALSSSDYFFVFTQAGIPVTIEAIVNDKGDLVDKVATYMTKQYATSGKNYFTNILENLVATAKTDMHRITKESNGNVRVTFPTRSSAPNGELKPFETVRDELIPVLNKLEQSQDEQVKFYFAVLNKPDNFVSKDGRFKTRGAAIEFAVNSIAHISGYAPEHVFLSRMRPKQPK